MSNNKIKIVALLSVAVLLAPSIGLAEDSANSVRQAKPAATAATKQNQYCVSLVNKAPQLTDKINKIEKDLAEHQSDRMGKLQDRQEKRLDALDNKRQDTDQFRTESFTALEKKAKNDAQLQAIKDFEKAVEDAVAARKAAVDSAVKSYQTSVQELLKSRQTKVQTAQANFKTAVQAATAKAQSDCSAGVDAATVRSTFEASMKAARDQFNVDRKQIDKYGPQISALEKSRNTAVQQALKNFKDALSTAKDALKAALKAASTTPTPTPTPTSNE